MPRKQVPIFATQNDLLKVIGGVDAVRPLMFVTAGLFDQSAADIRRSAASDQLSHSGQGAKDRRQTHSAATRREQIRSGSIDESGQCGFEHRRHSGCGSLAGRANGNRIGK